MLIVNFSTRTLSAEELSMLADITSVPVGEILQVIVSANQPAGSYEERVAQLVDAIGYTREQLQTCPILVIPPESSAVTCGLLAALHWSIGHFPSLLYWRDGGSIDVVNLQLIRSLARCRRYTDR